MDGDIFLTLHLLEFGYLLLNQLFYLVSQFSSNILINKLVYHNKQYKVITLVLIMHDVNRPIEEKTKGEIERKLEKMGDYVKMSYLQRALQSGFSYDTRKFILLKLSEIYESRKMFLEAARMIRSAAEINTTFKNKMQDYMKAVNLYIKGLDYFETDRMFAQALALASNKEKLELKGNFKDFHLEQARSLLNADKRNQAKIVYEKILTLELDIGERRELQKQLLDLYDKLGLVKDYYKLKKSM